MTAPSSRRLLPLYIACYAIVLALAFMGAWLIFAARPVLFSMAVWMRLNPWQVRALDNFSVVTMGLIWLVGVLALEHSLRTGVEKGRLWGRAVRAFVIVAVPLGLCYAIQALNP
jgi:branched-subunit amino acid transport protein